MTRPLVLRCLPDRLRQSAYYRYYHRHHTGWKHLFKAAPLTFAPQMAMFDLLEGDVISGNIAFNGFYELELSQRIHQLAREGGTLVDVGANMGYFSLLWCAAHPHARAIAFEASPRNTSLLESNVEKNGLAERVSIVAKAASDQVGMVNFSLGPKDQTGWGGISAAGSSLTVSVPATRLDQELPDAPIEVLKVDVEGADTMVLYGCEALLKKKRIGTIFFEQNASRMAELGIAKGDAQKFLRSFGYRCEPLDDEEDEWVALVA